MYRLVLSLSLALLCADATAGTITLADVCDGYMLTRRASDGALIVRCPGVPEPWLTLPDCKRPAAKVRKTPMRTAEGGVANINVVAITCN